jgi:hypothetical protein
MLVRFWGNPRFHRSYAYLSRYPSQDAVKAFLLYQNAQSQQKYCAGFFAAFDGMELEV